MKKKLLVEEIELENLKKKSKPLARYIEVTEFPERYGETDPFISLMSGFVSQLVSAKTADTIFKRIEVLVGEITPETIHQVDAMELKKCGMSMKKVDNMKRVAGDVVNKMLDLEQLREKSEEEIMQILLPYPGIGQWTVEMLMIFSLEKKDVLSYLDLGIRKGICEVYKIEKLDKKRFEKIKKAISPYGSIASIYFWHAHRQQQLNQ